MLFQSMAAACTIAALSVSPPADGQRGGYHAARARRHFISIGVERQFIEPYAFNRHPLPDLLGQPVSEVHLQDYQYQTRDGSTNVNVLEFGHRGIGIGATIFPLGESVGPTLAIRASYSQLPTIRLAFSGASPLTSYSLTNGSAYDLGAGVDMADRSPGWGLGSHAFVLGGVGRTHADESNGTRYFAEGGGGVTSGPFGVDLSFKFTVNRFTAPVPHTIYLIPISVRATLTF
jgi:hypothetical protein